MRALGESRPAPRRQLAEKSPLGIGVRAAVLLEMKSPGRADLARASCHADGEVSAGWGSLARSIQPRRRAGVNRRCSQKSGRAASVKRRRVVLLGQWLGRRRRWRPWSEPPPGRVVRTD